MKPAYRRVLLWHVEWMLDEIVVAGTHRARLFGLNLRGVRAILMYTASIHTFTMREPIRVTQISSAGRVGYSEVVQPRQVMSFPERTWVLESSVDIDGPPAGVVVRVLPSGFDVRDTHTLRYADRKPI
jgi:hypothetical protein